MASGERAYASGFEDGRFYANGWHIAGEMGGVWTPPLKLLDGIWFGVDGQWIGPATRFASGWGYTRFELPDTAGLHLSRVDFAPDARRAVLFGLNVTNPGATKRTVSVMVDAHSELMTAYPWGFSGTTPNASHNLPDHGSFTGDALQFTDRGTPPDEPGTPPHSYAALVAANQRPVSGVAADTGGDFRGPQDHRVCQQGDSTSPPSACDDGPFGRGTGGELHYSIDVPAGATRTLWVAAAGSDHGGIAAARQELAGALASPERELASKIESRRQLAGWSQVSLPGDSLLQQAITWGKQNLADLTQTASNLQVRWTNQGKQWPQPLGTVPFARWFGAGFPDYPWIFAADAEYTTFAALALGQFQTAEDHLRALRDISDILNSRSGIVVHETVSDGSVWFGHDSTTTNPDGTKTNDFNTDETVKFPSTVALIWRWTGDNRFRDEMYDFARRNLIAVDRRLDVDRDGWPEGSGNVERTGMGPEKLDVGVYYMRALYDLADMARSKGDRGTAAWATHLGNRLRRQFEQTWWDPSVQQYADSLIDPGNMQSFQKHWIGQVPMEAELTSGTKVIPGVANYQNGTAALTGRENSCYSGDRPGNLGLFHTGCGGGSDGKGDTEIFSLTTSIQAVGEGNYGRLGPGQQQRYTDANAETMFSEPATGNTPDEQPGAMPEIFPSAPFGDPAAGVRPNIDRCWTCRSMFMQAWGNYGTAWSVIHQQLGVNPFLNYGELDVVPQVPPGQGSVAGLDVRLGTGAADVFAAHAGRRYTTTVALNGLTLRTLRLGRPCRSGRACVPRCWTVKGFARLPHGALRRTNRGLELTLAVPGGSTGGPHTLIVTVR